MNTLDLARQMLEAQGLDGNWDSSDYMLGMYNGMECIIAMFENRDPEYRRRMKVEEEKSMKPDWKDAPDWAQWLARDTKGGWWWYECEPLPFDGDFVGLGLTVGRVQQASCCYEPVWEKHP